MLTAVTATTTALPTPDLGRMRTERLARMRTEMQTQGVDAAALLHGPHVTSAPGFVVAVTGRAPELLSAHP